MRIDNVQLIVTINGVPYAKTQPHLSGATDYWDEVNTACTDLWLDILDDLDEERIEVSEEGS